MPNVKNIKVENVSYAIYDVDAHTKISALTNTVSGNKAAIEKSLSDEVTARKNADTQLQKNIDNASTYVNAVSQGMVPGNASKASSNTQILQSLLDAGKTVFIPSGVFYLSGTIYMKKGCGIIGANMRESCLQWNSATDGIVYDLEYDAAGSYDSIYFNIMLQNVALYGAGAVSGAGSGLYIRNKTFIVTAKGNHETYKQLKGDSYALECRNSPIRDLIISGWGIGLNSSFYIAYLSAQNIFIDTCDLGIDSKFSDSQLANIVVTFCYNGILCEAEANKWSNVSIKMCGYRSAYDSSHAQTNSIGLHLYAAKRELFANTEVQECYANGAIVEQRSHDIVFSGLNVDANGFKESGNNNIGIQFLGGCYNIRGTIIATNKNSNKTQRAGIYVSDDCGNIDVQYTEYDQKSSAWTLGRSTARSITTGRLNNCTPITAPNFTNGVPTSYASFDGRKLHIGIHGYFTSPASAGTKFALANVFGDVPYKSLPGNVYKDLFIYNSTDNALIHAHYDNTDGSIKLDASITNGKQINAEVEFDML